MPHIQRNLLVATEETEFWVRRKRVELRRSWSSQDLVDTDCCITPDGSPRTDLDCFRHRSRNRPPSERYCQFAVDLSG